LLSAASFAQSTLSDHPTPITTNEVAGIIKARDLGDARLTTHYYWFDGSQGDVFINLTSKNFAGDIDVFAQNGLKPLTKIVVYADFGEVETGRVVYLRKPERLLLRVQGRTPDDEAATYRLKFAGSFVAATPNEKDVPAMPTVGDTVAGAVRVNSVGTILPPIPKPVPEKTEAENLQANASSEAKGSDESAKDKVEANKPEEAKIASKPEVVVEDRIADSKRTETTPSKLPPKRNRASRNTSPKKADMPKVEADRSGEQPSGSKEATETEASKEAADRSKTSVPPVKSDAKVDPLANIRLVIVFKDGAKIERPLPDVFKFSVDRGVLTVISKDGRVGKYQMLDVAKVTIE
jgi:hypothetical protein